MNHPMIARARDPRHRYRPERATTVDAPVTCGCEVCGAWPRPKSAVCAPLYISMQPRSAVEAHDPRGGPLLPSQSPNDSAVA